VWKQNRKKGKEESFEFHFKLEKTFAKVLKLHKAHDKENKVCCFSTTSAHSVDFSYLSELQKN
jgi:hypothetical protein